MISLLDQYSFENIRSAVGLADTLHNLGVLCDAEFDIILADIYERYGDDEYGNLCNDDYL